MGILPVAVLITATLTTADQDPEAVDLSKVAFTLHLDGAGLEPAHVTIEEWDTYTSYIRRTYPVYDEAFFLNRTIRQFVEQKTALMVHREGMPQLQKTAAEIMKKLDGGAKFSRMAKLYSDEGTSRRMGGVAGDYNRRMSRYPLEVELFALDAGQHGGPIWTQYGAEIFLVEQRAGERGTMSEVLKVRHILLRWPPNNKFKEPLKSLVRRHLQLSTSHDRFRRILPPGLQKDPPAQFGPTDVAPLGEPTKPLTQVSDLDSKNGKVRDPDSDPLEQQKRGQ